MLGGMKHAATVVMATALLGGGGCGGGGEPSIDGIWAAELNSGCAAILGFDMKERSYGSMVFCQTGPTSIGGDLEEGDADFSTVGMVKGTPKRASCPSSDHAPSTAHYSFSGEQLVFSTDSGSIILNRVKDMASTMTGTVSWGCWNMGAFEPHPVQPLPAR
jgi:hypothetical protein